MTTDFISLSDYIDDNGTSGERILASDSVKVTTSVFIMGDHTNYGQLYTANQDTRFMWDCKLDQNTYATPKSGGMCYKNGVQTGKDGFSYLTSALTYSGGFTMNYSYTFDRSYGDAYGYVQAKNENGTDKSKKLSFVGNGGIKYGGESGSFEAAIFDVRAMVAMILNDPSVVSANKLSDTQINHLSTLLKEEQASEKSIQDVNKSFAAEPITKLLDAVGYGAGITSVYNDLYTRLENTLPDTEKNKILALFLAEVFETAPNGQVVRLEITNPTDAYNNTINISDKNQTYYSDEKIPLTSTTDEFTGQIYLQAHWGSGVEYVVSSIISKNR